jgi:hypothetical protein
MARKVKEIVVSKDDAVFWLDKHGRWNNEHGEFQHKKIIDFFHASIRRDKDGYYLSQFDGNCREKVYFHFEDTALFVVDVIRGNDIVLVLNTKKQVKLRPRRLSVKDDSLYMHMGEERVKFSPDSLVKLSHLMEYTDDRYFITVKGRRYRIAKK